MPRYSDEQREELRERYLQAAADLATRQGWGGVSVRNIAELVGKSASPIHREGMGWLKKQLVTEAFAALKVPLVAFMDVKPVPPLDTLHARLLEHLRARPEAARLMVQASAQVGLTGSDEAQTLSDHFLTQHQRTVSEVASFCQCIEPSLARTTCYTFAEGLVRWYVAVCVTLVTDPCVNDPWLLAMAIGQDPHS